MAAIGCAMFVSGGLQSAVGWFGIVGALFFGIAAVVGLWQGTLDAKATPQAAATQVEAIYRTKYEKVEIKEKFSIVSSLSVADCCISAKTWL